MVYDFTTQCHLHFFYTQHDICMKKHQGCTFDCLSYNTYSLSPWVLCYMAPKQDKSCSPSLQESHLCSCKAAQNSVSSFSVHIGDCALRLSLRSPLTASLDFCSGVLFIDHMKGFNAYSNFTTYFHYGAIYGNCTVPGYMKGGLCGQRLACTFVLIT